MYIKTTTATVLTVLLLALHGQTVAAYDPEKLDDTLKATTNAAKGVLTQVLDRYRNSGIVCPHLHFKTGIVSTSAHCQLVEDYGAMDECRAFGSSCIVFPGRWGCGSWELEDGSGGRGCLFQPRRAPSGVKFPKVKFDFDDDLGGMWDYTSHRALHYQRTQ
ncbi:hypothetical protein BGZ97_011785 [Linnemannia gamsii]|uniref:Uncharacterized protein n=1 Tax=Linnemannia gamsii TaxID=64522 RepID=A0A9P6R786_9FUNG|nr:hypothetical protein BGZ97_011785 [Linnemannia gamsii]